MNNPLADWLRVNGITRQQFAALAELPLASVVRFCTGERYPTFDAMRRIHSVTGDEVTHYDFFKWHLEQLSPQRKRT